MNLLAATIDRDDPDESWTTIQVLVTIAAAETAPPPQPLPVIMSSLVHVKRVWIFQAKREVHDLRANADRDHLFWYSRKRYSSDILRGDIVYLWQSGEQAGLFGWALVKSDRPVVIREDERRDDEGRADIRIDLTFRQRFDPPIPKSRVRAFEGLQQLSILKVRAGAIHDVKQTPERNEAQKLSDLVKEEGYTVPVPLALDVSSLAALEYANGLREASGSDEVQMDHLLQGLLADPDGPARRLVRAGIDGVSLKSKIAWMETLQPTAFPPVTLTGLPPLSVDTRRTLVAAEELAYESRSGTIRSEHLLHGWLSIGDPEVVQRFIELGFSSGTSFPSSPPPPESTSEQGTGSAARGRRPSR